MLIIPDGVTIDIRWLSLSKCVHAFIKHVLWLADIFVMDAVKACNCSKHIRKWFEVFCNRIFLTQILSSVPRGKGNLMRQYYSNKPSDWLEYLLQGLWLVKAFLTHFWLGPSIIAYVSLKPCYLRVQVSTAEFDPRQANDHAIFTTSQSVEPVIIRMTPPPYEKGEKN
jgi:hypothetical protein